MYGAMCIWKSTRGCSGTEENVRSLEDGVTGVCETLDGGSWKGTLNL